LKPVKDLGLREDQRVRLIVETVEDKAADRGGFRDAAFRSPNDVGIRDQDRFRS
jgi:hypothetical protein